MFVAVGDLGTIVISPDGQAWEQRVSTTNEDLFGVAVGTERIVAVGHQGTIVTSPDGETWALAEDSPTNASLTGVAFGAGKFVAVGLDGAILTSQDGVAWTLSDPVTTEGLMDVICENGHFVAVGDNGTILISPDGLNWTSWSELAESTFLGAAYGGGQFVVVGSNGIALNASANADLESLTVSPGTLTPVFNADTVAYSVYLNHGVDQIVITAEPDDDDHAQMTINGVPWDGENPLTVDLDPGANPAVIEIVVESQAGTTKTYTVTAYVAGPDGGGTLTSNVTTVPAGSGGHTLVFEYAGNLYNGSVEIDVPAGWSPPSVTPGDPGYTRAGKGTVSVSGNTVIVSGVTMFDGETLTIAYGDTSGGGPGAVAPAASGTQVWQARSMGDMGGTPQNLSVSPVITVEPAAPASVSVTANPASVLANGVSKSTVTARVQDAHGNDVKDGTRVIFAVTGGQAALTRADGTTSGRRRCIRPSPAGLR